MRVLAVALMLVLAHVTCVLGGVSEETPGLPQTPGTNLDDPFGTAPGTDNVGQTTLEDYFRAFPPQPIMDPDGTHWLMGASFQWIWDQAAPDHRHIDQQTGRRMVYDSNSGHWVQERQAVTSVSSSSATTAAAATQEAPATEEFHVPWPIPTAVGEVEYRELTSGDVPPEDLPSTLPQTQRGWNASVTTHQCQAGQVVSVDLWAEFDCVVYLIGPNNEIIAGCDDWDVMARNHSRLENVTVPAAGNYRVVVSSQGPNTTGHYWLSLGGRSQLGQPWRR